MFSVTSIQSPNQPTQIIIFGGLVPTLSPSIKYQPVTNPSKYTYPNNELWVYELESGIFRRLNPPQMPSSISQRIPDARSNAFLVSDAVLQTGSLVLAGGCSNIFHLFGGVNNKDQLNDHWILALVTSPTGNPDEKRYNNDKDNNKDNEGDVRQDINMYMIDTIWIRTDDSLEGKITTNNCLHQIVINPQDSSAIPSVRFYHTEQYASSINIPVPPSFQLSDEYRKRKNEQNSLNEEKSGKKQKQSKNQINSVNLGVYDEYILSTPVFFVAGRVPPQAVNGQSNDHLPSESGSTTTVNTMTHIPQAVSYASVQQSLNHKETEKHQTFQKQQQSYSYQAQQSGLPSPSSGFYFGGTEGLLYEMDMNALQNSLDAITQTKQQTLNSMNPYTAFSQSKNLQPFVRLSLISRLRPAPRQDHTLTYAPGANSIFCFGGKK
ncbi:MAG: hypothetical protein EZS28_045332, partial [Streblomastix strix]